MGRRWNAVDVGALGFVVTVFASLVLVLGCREERTQPGASDARPQRPRLGFEAAKTACMNHVKNLVGHLEVAAMVASDYPEYAGPNLVLYLVAQGDLKGERGIGMLFCPGDEKESLATAGGTKAYRDLDLDRRGEYGHLTSYAGRDQFDPACRATRRGQRLVVLVCDDSEDHHGGKGVVVGLTGGAVKWRSKVDWGVPDATVVEVGPETHVEELRCLRAE